MLHGLMNPLLAANQVSFSRSNMPVFEPVDLSVSSGQLALILGTNGCGKTTLLRLLAGILPAHVGEVARPASIAFIGHRSGIKTDLNCIENLQFYAAFSPRSPHQPPDTPAQALDRVGLWDHRRQLAATLSAGQNQRLALARLLVAPAQLWLIDEPYTSLDDAGCELFDELLTEHLATGGAAVVTAHQRKPDVDLNVMVELIIQPGCGR